MKLWDGTTLPLQSFLYFDEKVLDNSSPARPIEYNKVRNFKEGIERPLGLR